MTLAAGSKLGPYEILGQIGAGGMGEVYRAKDPRLAREVAIKVLPASFSQDADRLRRFEQEAKAAGVLNHPNITAVYDIGTHADAPYVVQELLEGETLRSVLAGGRVSARKAIEYSLQIANGLSAAHEKGIVHRDLKPENLFVTKDGRIKILDFGLAKLTHQEEGSQVTNLPTATAGTEPGVVLGTIGYMSPEQVRGKPADARSDIFSFGAILYEMLSGKRAFQGDSAADTMSSILREDPPDLSVTNQAISPGLERIVRHCLEKNPEQRFHSAHDVAFALDAISGTSGTSLPLSAGIRPSKPRSLRLLVTAGVLLTAAALGFLAGNLRDQAGQPSFKRLTFRKGAIWTARFAPDGQTVVYSAAWEGNPVDVFLTRPESPESRPFGLKDASLFGVSRTGELAVMLDAGTSARAWERFGTLARLPLAGGSPRPVLENVRYADWAPDGRELMVERTVGGKHRIEFPIGKVLYESANRLETPRVSLDGRAIAFFEVEAIGEGGPNNVAVRVVDLAGQARTLASASDWWNLAWSPDGREVWYAAPEAGQPMGQSPLQAVSLSGKSRLLLRLPGTLELHDVAPDGRVLFGRMSVRNQIDVLLPGESLPRDLSWLERSELHGLSADGGTILLAETAEGGGPNQSIYLRRTDGSPATLIGEGQPHDLSPDGRWALATAPSRSLVLLPTGTGSPRTLAFEGLKGNTSGAFFPDGRNLVVENSQPGELPRLYVAPVEGGKPRPLGSPGLRLTPFGNPVSPDGRLVAAIDGERKCFLLPTDGGAPRPLPGDAVGEIPIQWSADGQFLYTHLPGELPAKVWRLGIATGRRELVKELVPRDPAGVLSVASIFVTSDGRSFFFSYGQILSDLYVAEGLK